MITKNQLLKIRLLVEGMKITEEAKKVLSNNGKLPISLFEYVTTGGIPLKIKNDDIFVNAHFGESFCKKAKLTLDFNGSEFFIIDNKKRTYVEPLPIPSYLKKKNKKGKPYTSFVMTNTDRVRVSPIQGCSFACKFCDLPRSYRYQKKDINELIEATKVAIEDPVLPGKHILISGGTPLPRDWKYMDDVYEKITKKFNLKVDIMMAPRPNLEYVDKLYSWGVNRIYANLELFNKKISSEMITGKYKLGRETYLKFLERAVEIFGKSNAYSILLIGLEPVKDTLKGVELLAAMGVSPVLSPFIPSPITPLKDVPPPSTKTLKSAWEESLKIVKKYGVKLGPSCIPCHHNSLSFADKSSFYHYS